MTEPIIIALISALVGGALVATSNHLFTRRKTAAEADKLHAETDRLRAETEKVKAETRLLTPHPNRDEADRAMASAIRDSENIVYIMGISLREFFGSTAGDAARALVETYSRQQKPHIKILLLDYESDDARTRASIEEAIPYAHRKNVVYERSAIYNDIVRTISVIQEYFPDVEVRLYKNQISFVLVTDTKIFVEPYHYDTPVQVQVRPILEISKSAAEGAYRQFLEHFDHVFDCARAVRSLPCINGGTEQVAAPHSVLETPGGNQEIPEEPPSVG